jgi:hypothetical protein
MKKITLLAIFIASSLNAQVFPDPYCSIAEDDFEDVEEITAISFNSQSIPFTSDASLVLLDRTSTVLNVQGGQSYPISLAGNTYGDFNNTFIVFIDWNKNGVLDDENEVYEIGDIFESTGDDGITADGSIDVPNDVTLGSTRMRILKMYNEPDFDEYGIIDPCVLLLYWESGDEEEGLYTSFGQFVDLTINVTSLSNDKFNKNLFSVYPNPVKDVLHLNSDRQIEEISIYNIQGQLVLNTKNSNQIDISSLSTGQYLVKASSEGMQYTEKLVKQ